MGKRKSEEQIMEDRKARAKRRLEQAGFRFRSVIASEQLRLKRASDDALAAGLTEDEVVEASQGTIQKTAEAPEAA